MHWLAFMASAMVLTVQERSSVACIPSSLVLRQYLLNRSTVACSPEVLNLNI